MSKSVVFYGKPACINNRKQIQLLVQAGIDVEEINIFEVQWSVARLSRFFNGMPLVDCVNPSAPLIKSGEIMAENIPRATLLQMMCISPVLIRRPLMIFSGKHWVGFNWDQLCLDLKLDSTKPVGNNIETCAVDEAMVK
jgi:nitrogenase-associated protein